MKIRRSLKAYFLVMMIITGISIITIMSVVSFNYFLTGVNFSLSNAMRAQAFKRPVSDGNPVRLNDFFIASRWEDLPEKIKTKLNENDLIENELLKEIDGNPLIEKPEAGYFVMKLISNDNQVRYVSTMFHKNNIGRSPRQNIVREPPPFLYLILIALGLMFVFALVPYIIIRKVATPIEKLMNWTKNLDNKQLSQPIPDFHYSELNNLASIVQSSLYSVQDSLEREQQFLGYASHELRTPIAITRTNTELLRKMIDKDIGVEKQLQVLDRLERASINMTDLTETLLWLNRKTALSIPLSSISIGLLTKQLLEELTYLLNGKSVEINIKTDETTQLLPEALCRIVINNLIRNALQHSTEGSIEITQSGHYLSIKNEEHSDLNKQSSSGGNIRNELGFGLGLELTERLVKQYNWQYINTSTEYGHYVEIHFK